MSEMSREKDVVLLAEIKSYLTLGVLGEIYLLPFSEFNTRPHVRDGRIYLRASWKYVFTCPVADVHSKILMPPSPRGVQILSISCSFFGKFSLMFVVFPLIILLVLWSFSLSLGVNRPLHELCNTPPDYVFGTLVFEVFQHKCRKTETQTMTGMLLYCYR